VVRPRRELAGKGKRQHNELVEQDGGGNDDSGIPVLVWIAAKYWCVCGDFESQHVFAGGSKNKKRMTRQDHP
jgi:hypothetical protein